MSDFLSSIRNAFGGKAEAPVDDPSNVVVDHPEQGFVVMPAEVAQRAGYPALLGIKPSQVPKDESKRLSMTALYRKRKAERIAREQAQEAKRAKANADLDERNKPFLEEQARRAAASFETQEAPLPKALVNVPAARALQALQRFTDAPAPAPAQVTPPPAPEPTLDVSPVGPAPAMSLPRSLPTPPPMADTDKAALLSMVGGSRPKPVAAPIQQAAPMPAPRVTPAVAPALVEEMPEVAPPAALPMPKARQVEAAPRPVMEEERPVSAPTPFAMPPARETAAPVPARDFSALVPPVAQEARWDESFSPDARVTPQDRAALLALASGKAGAPLRAPAGAMGGDTMGSLFTTVAEPQSDTSMDMDARDAAALKALAAAQRSDDISSGIGALGDVFGQARDLILNRPLQPLRQRGTSAVEQERQRQELLASQQKMRRDNRLADATVAAKKNDAAKDEASLAAANAKSQKEAQSAAAASALNDPKSPETERVRQLAKQLLGQRVDDSVWDNMSGTEIKDVALKYGVPLTSAEAQAGLGARRIEQTMQDQRDDNYFKKRQLDLDIAQLELAHERLKQQGEDTDAARDLRERLAKLEAERRDSEHKEKLSQLNVGGFNYDPKDPPSPNGAKTMADVAVARDEVLGSLNRLESLYAQHGPTMIGPVAGQMETEWMNITNRLRTLNEMGVPNGADYLMLAKQIQDPTSIRAKGTSAARAQAQFTQLRDQVRRKVDATAKAYKYTPESGRSSPSAALPAGADGNPTLDEPRARPVLPPVSAPSSGGVKTVSIKGMKPGDLKESLAEGESVRYPIGNGQYQVVRRKGDKLVKVRVE